MSRVAATQPLWLEQLSVLSTVVAWGMEGLLLLDDVDTLLGRPSASLDDLGAVAADIEIAEVNARIMETLASALL